MTVMRAKMRVNNVEKVADDYERLTLNPVAASRYPSDGADEDNSYARWTPNGLLTLDIRNPNLIGKFAIGDVYYLDFTKAE